MTSLIVNSALHVAPFLLAGILALTFATPAAANFCHEQTLLGASHSNTKQTGSTNPPMHFNINGVKGNPLFDAQCAAAGTCTAVSLSEQAPGAIYTTYVTKDPDIDQHRFGIFVDPPGPKPPVFVGTPWQDGLCP